MEEYFKFIPVALWILYKIFGSSNTKKQKSNQRTKTNERTSTSSSTPSLEDILRELSGEPKKKKAHSAPIPAKSERARTKIFKDDRPEEVVDHQHDFRPEYEHHADTGPSLASLRVEIEEDQHWENNEQEVADFDLKQAIIHQTILTRPEY